MLSGFSFFMGPEEIGIVGSKNDPRTQAMLREIYLTFLPNKILSFRDPEEPDQRQLDSISKGHKGCGITHCLRLQGFQLPATRKG